MDPFSLAEPAQNLMVIDSSRCTLQFFFSREEALAPEDGGGAVAITIEDRFFALTAKHILELFWKYPHVGGGFGLSKYSRDARQQEPLNALRRSDVVAVAPRVDAALFELHPADEAAAQRLKARALPIDRLLLPTPSAPHGLTVPAMLCGFPRSLASPDLALLNSFTQFHYMGVVANDRVRRDFEQSIERIDLHLLLETDEQNWSDGDTGNFQLPALRGCSGAGYFVAAVRKGSLEYYTGLAGIHTQSLSGLDVRQRVQTVLAGPSAHVFASMLWTAAEALRGEMQELWPTFEPVDTEIEPFGGDDDE